MSGNQKKGIVISALSFPLAYVLGVMLFHITQMYHLRVQLLHWEVMEM